MTLIIGTRCRDGVTLAADQKIVRGGETDYQSKLSTLGGVVLAFEGLAGVRTDFLYALEREFMTLDDGFSSMLEAKLVMEDLVKVFHERYVDRIGQEAYFGAMIAGLQEITSGPAQLYYIHPAGYGEAVNYRCSGHGAEYAHSIATHLIARNESVIVNAVRSAFVISWVAEGVDNTVGGEPQVAILRDDNPDCTYLPSALVGSASNHTDTLKQSLLEGFGMTESWLQNLALPD